VPSEVIPVGQSTIVTARKRSADGAGVFGRPAQSRAGCWGRIEADDDLVPFVGCLFSVAEDLGLGVTH
jgi:hypothetical protein